MRNPLAYRSELSGHDKQNNNNVFCALNGSLRKEFYIFFPTGFQDFTLHVFTLHSPTYTS